MYHNFIVMWLLAASIYFCVHVLLSNGCGRVSLLGGKASPLWRRRGIGVGNPTLYEIVPSKQSGHYTPNPANCATLAG